MSGVTSRRSRLAHEAVREGPAEPKADATWQRFCQEKEDNSALARDEWPRFRQGLRRLERRYAGRLPLIPLQRALAEDAFFGATHWRHNRRIVLPALERYLGSPIGPRAFTFAAAEFWHWARFCSPGDLPGAEELLALTPGCLEQVDELNRRNLTAMLQQVVERHRPAVPPPAGG